MNQTQEKNTAQMKENGNSAGQKNRGILFKVTAIILVLLLMGGIASGSALLIYNMKSG